MSLLRPNTVASPSAKALVAFAWGAVVLVVWSASGSYMVPSPGETMSAMGSLVVHDGLLHELLVSLGTNLEAVAISALASLLISYLYVLPAGRPLPQMTAKARFLGLSGFVVIFTMMFGGGHALKLSLLVFGMTTFYVTSMASVIADIPASDYDQARSLRMGPWRTVLEVVVIGRLSDALEVTRQNAAMGWVMLTMVEGLVRSEGGVGALILNQSKHIRLDAVFAATICIGLIGVLQDALLTWTKAVLCPHASLTAERR